MITLAIMMMSLPSSVAKLCVSQFAKFKKESHFFFPFEYRFMATAHTLKYTQRDIQDSTRRRDAPQQATKFSEAHRNDTIPIAR